MYEEFFELKSKSLEIFYDQVYGEEMTYSQATGKTCYDLDSDNRQYEVEKAIILITVFKRLLVHNGLIEYTRQEILESKEIVNKCGNDISQNEANSLLKDIELLLNKLDGKEIPSKQSLLEVKKIGEKWGYNELRCAITERFYNLLLDETKSYEDVTRIIFNEFKEEMDSDDIYKVITICTTGACLERKNDFSDYFIPFAKEALNIFNYNELNKIIPKDLYGELSWNCTGLECMLKKKNT